MMHHNKLSVMQSQILHVIFCTLPTLLNFFVAPDFVMSAPLAWHPRYYVVQLVTVEISGRGVKKSG